MNTTRLLPLLLLAILGGSTFADVCDAEPAASWKWAPEGVPAGICDGIHNSHRCVQRIEPHTLRQAPEGVERAAGVLRIAVPRGDTVVFEDREGERGPFYLYLGHLPSGHHLVFVQHYEGGDHVLVDDVTGAQSPLGGRPIFAPGGEYLAAVKSGERPTVEQSLQRLSAS